MLNEFLADSSKQLILPAVLGAGLLDGLSPCVIAILIFFIALLLGLRRTFKNILFLGLIYISIVFITYLAVGLGLLSGIVLFGQHHFFAKLAAWLLIGWGLLQLKAYFFPQWLGSWSMPKIASEKVKVWLKRATLGSVIGAAFLVGLCAVPCSAGIYAAITSLLASQTTYLTGFVYLFLYNLMVILPLLVLLFLAVNPFTLAKLAQWQQDHQARTRLVSGLTMIGLGAIILIFFV